MKPKAEKIIKYKGISFSDLMEIVSWGVNARKVQKGKGSIELSCYNGGHYRGSPGRDIGYCLPHLSKSQMMELARLFAKKFGKKPPSNHLAHAACIRFVYGQWDKQGSLFNDTYWYHSLDDVENLGLKKDAYFYEMAKDPPNWTLPRSFMKMVMDNFREFGNNYGLAVSLEMEAHRLGDDALLTKSADKIEEMDKAYCDSVFFATKCRSYKHMFSPYYWDARYLMKLGQKQLAIKRSINTINQGIFHCPDRRKSYIEKFYHCAKYIKMNRKSGSSLLKKIMKTKNIKDAPKVAIKVALGKKKMRFELN